MNHCIDAPCPQCMKTKHITQEQLSNIFNTGRIDFELNCPYCRLYFTDSFPYSVEDITLIQRRGGFEFTCAACKERLMLSTSENWNEWI